MSAHLLERLTRAERLLGDLQVEVAEIRAAVHGDAMVAAPVDEPAAPEPAPAPAVEAGVPEWHLPEPIPREWISRTRPALRPGDLLGAGGLAWAGGIVTVLGIVFFFALAVNRGWIGPSARVGLGGTAAVLVFAAGVFLRRRYGDTHASLAAVGAGIAGAYATVLATAVHYDLVPDAAALALGGLIAAVALGVALVWPSEILAGIGLVGATVVPAFLAIDVGMTRLGAVFVEIVFAVAVAVALHRGWRPLLIASTAAAVPQIAVLVTPGGTETDWRVIALTAVFVALLLGAGIARALITGGTDQLAGGYVLGAGAFSLYTIPELFAHAGAVDRRGLAFLAVGAVFAVVSAGFFRREGHRDLSGLLGAVALAIGAVAAGDLLSGQTLALTWAAEAAVLAWLAARLGEPRLKLGSLVYLALAALHAVALDAPPSGLFVDVAHPARGAASLVGVAAAALVYAWYSRRDEELGHGVTLPGRTLRLVAGFGGAVLAAAAAALGILALPEPFEWGHVGVDGLLSLSALVLLLLGLARRSSSLQIGGLVWLGAAAAKAVFFDLIWLDSTPRSYGFLIVGGAALLGGFLYEVLRGDKRLLPVPVAALALSATFSVWGAVELVEGGWQGAALLAVAGVYALFGAAVFQQPRLRDLSTLHWATALVVAGPAAAELSSGTPLVLAWATAAAGLAILGRLTGEPRLQAGSLGYLLAAFVHTVVLDASPDHLFVANRHPAAGVGALALVVAAAAVFAAQVPREVLRRGRISAISAVGVLAAYGVSLAILELFQTFGAASVHTSFQRGHTAVSALWGLLGLVLLYLGLTRHTAFRFAGFALFGLSLAKLFLYDLAFLSSIARALSFLAVGAVLLLGGFFYQRLSMQLQTDEANGGIPLPQ